MSKFTLNFENIPRSIVSKKHSNLLNPSIPIKPQLEWLRNYLRSPGQQALEEPLKPNLSKKSTTRRLLKTKHKTLLNNNNENRNTINETRFGILSNKTIVKGIQDGEGLGDGLAEGHARRNSCQLFRNGRKDRDGRMRVTRPDLPRVNKIKYGKESALTETLDPWQIEQIKTQAADPDIVGYMFTRLH